MVGSPDATVFPMCPERWHPVEHRGNVQQKEFIMATIIAQPSSLEIRQELDLEGLEEALEEQVQDYFSDWEDEPCDGGRIVFG